MTNNLTEDEVSDLLIEHLINENENLKSKLTILEGKYSDACELINDHKKTIKQLKLNFSFINCALIANFIVGALFLVGSARVSKFHLI
jgi:hypothetical protein